MVKNDILESKVMGGGEQGRKGGRKIGREEGRAEGREEGRKEGRKIGRAEGREEAIVAIARKLKQRGASVAEIAELTGLSEEKFDIL